MLQTNLNLEKEIIEIDLVIKELEDNLENKLVTIKDFEKNMNEKKESIELLETKLRHTDELTSELEKEILEKNDTIKKTLLYKR